MFKRVTSCFLVGILCLLTGCGNILDRAFISVEPHNDLPEVVGTSDAIRVENYQEIVNALLYFVTNGQHSGTLRLYDYNQEVVERDLSAACLEVSKEDALGAYSVEYIQFDLETIISYQQADIQITYRRSREQVDAIISTVGPIAVRQQLGKSLSAFDDDLVLKLNYFDGNENALLELISRAYYEYPSSALGLPTTEITLYPRTGPQRIAELLIDYPLDAVNRNTRQTAMLAKAKDCISELPKFSDNDYLLQLSDALLALGGLQPTGSTAYSALCDGGGDSEGLALAYALLCEEAGIPCIVVSGTLDKEPHFWNIVMTSGGYRHLDITALAMLEVPDEEEPPNPLLSDRQADGAGYEWNEGWVPLCGTQPDLDITE